MHAIVHGADCAAAPGTPPHLVVTLALGEDLTRVRATWREICPECGEGILYQQRHHGTANVLRDVRYDAIPMVSTWLHRADTWTNETLPW